MWYELMHIANVAGWPEWFEVWTSELTRRTEMTDTGVKKARKALSDKGYIQFEARGNKAARYKILSQIVNYREEEDDTADTASETVHKGGCEVGSEHGCEHGSECGSEPSSECGSEVGSDIHRIDKIREEDIRDNTPPITPPTEPPKKKTAKKAVRDVFAEYAGDNLELLQALRDMAANRKALRKPYATDRARELACEELDKLAGDNAEMKIKIIEQSIMRGWQGLFALKDEEPKAAGKPPEEKKEKAGRYDFAEIRRRDRERLKRLAEEEI